MVCEQVGKKTQMRHDILADALRLVVPACSCQSTTERRYRALAGKKGMEKGMVEYQRRGDILAVLPGLSLRQWMSWLRTRLRSRTLLRLPRQVGGLRRGLNRRRGCSSGRLCWIMLHSGLCWSRLRYAGTWAMRRCSS